MKNELILLIEKLLREQASLEEIVRLKKLFTQVESKDILSGFYHEEWKLAGFSSMKEVEERIKTKLMEQTPMNLAPQNLPFWKKVLQSAASSFMPVLCLGGKYS